MPVRSLRSAERFRRADRAVPERMQGMSDQPLLYTKRDDAVAVVSTDDDPLNRMTLAYVDRLEEVIEDIASDDSIRAFVLTAEGTTNFSVGMNLKELPAGLQRAGDVDAFFDQRLRLIRRIETMGKPSVATLFGYCLGGGLELPLGCTLRLAATEGARIGLPELDLGTTPAWGGSARLAKTVGRVRALDMILRAKTLSGPEALEIGLVNEVWPSRTSRTAPSRWPPNWRRDPASRSGRCSTPSSTQRTRRSTSCWPQNARLCTPPWPLPTRARA